MFKRFVNYSIIFKEFDLKDIKVLTGDTCQTISKTNVFRFCDLNNVKFKPINLFILYIKFQILLIDYLQYYYFFFFNIKYKLIILNYYN